MKSGVQFMPQLSHKNIIKLVQAFAPRIKDEGVCSGFTSMWIQAELTNEQAADTFFNRLENIQNKYVKNNQIDIAALMQDYEHATEKVKSKEPLTEEDLALIDIRAFCESVAIHHDPKLNTDFTTNPFVGQGTKELLYPLTYSKELEASKPIDDESENIFAFHNIKVPTLDKSEYGDYLEKVKDVLKENVENNGGKIYILNGVSKHAVGLMYPGEGG